ncbi:MAG: ribosomal protein S18-alanine N-acetyltransferase [Thermoproteota archaeon]
MLQTFHIREFTTDDLESVKYINRLCLPENYTDHFFVDLYHRFPETFLVAEERNQVVAYIMCRIETGLSIFGLHGLIKKGHIVSLAVLPQHRRRGIGQALVKGAMENMYSYKAEQCFLEVRKSNGPAIALYKKLGFQISRTVQHYYADGEDAYLMSINLKSK